MKSNFGQVQLTEEVNGFPSESVFLNTVGKGTPTVWPCTVGFRKFINIEKFNKFISNEFIVETNSYELKNNVLVLDELHAWHKSKSILFKCEFEDISQPNNYFTNESNNRTQLKNPEEEAKYYFKFFFTLEVKETVQKLIDDLKEIEVEPVTSNNLNLITKNQHGFDLTTFQIAKPEIDLDLHYGKGFTEIYDLLLEKLRTKSKGIALLYGLPGTGKSVLIRKLINEVSSKERKLIYCPPEIATAISDPSFIPFLMEYPNSILIIEDAENIIKSRKSTGNQAVANLLNLADGLLSDALNISIICTFNCNFDDVDSALKRKGRLLMEHSFENLSIEDSQRLINKLQIDFKVTTPMSLAEIFNIKDFTGKATEKAVGFGFRRG